MTVIYGLLCPETDELRYIGKADDPPARLRSHISRARVSAERHHSVRWIRSLLRRGLRPKMIILEHLADGADWAEAERRHIAEALARGARLTNSTPGGEGIILGASARKRLAKKSAQRWRDPAYAERCRASLSAAISRKFAEDSEYRERCKKGSQQAWAIRKSRERYQIDEVRDLVGDLPNIIHSNEVRARFEGTSRTIISRHLKALCGEGLIHPVAKGVYAKDLSDPQSIAAEIIRGYGFDVSRDDFECVSSKARIRLRSVYATREPTWHIQINGSWLNITDSARARLAHAAAARTSELPEVKARRSERAKTLWANPVIRERRVAGMQRSFAQRGSAVNG